MISTSDFKNGNIISVNNEPYQIIWFQNHKPGKGGAIIRVKLKHIKKKSIINRTFKSGEKFKILNLVKQKKQFLYKNGINFNFMDNNTYEQIIINESMIDEKSKFLKENTEVEVVYLDNEIIDINLPITIEMKVIHTENEIKGDSVSNNTKIATIETGANIRVPLFIKNGDIIKIDTRTSKYIERI
jgi:elongation factor P